MSSFKPPSKQTRQVPVLGLCELGYYDLGIWNLRLETDTDVSETQRISKPPRHLSSSRGLDTKARQVKLVLNCA